VDRTQTPHGLSPLGDLSGKLTGCDHRGWPCLHRPCLAGLTGTQTIRTTCPGNREGGQPSLLRIALALTVPLLGVPLAACSQLPGAVTCSVDASTFNTSGPGETGTARICRTVPDRS
jgi:hypothetical protein